MKRSTRSAADRTWQTRALVRHFELAGCPGVAARYRSMLPGAAESSQVGEVVPECSVSQALEGIDAASEQLDPVGRAARAREVIEGMVERAVGLGVARDADEVALLARGTQALADAMGVEIDGRPLLAARVCVDVLEVVQSTSFEQAHAAASDALEAVGPWLDARALRCDLGASVLGRAFRDADHQRLLAAARSAGAVAVYDYPRAAHGANRLGFDAGVPNLDALAEAADNLRALGWPDVDQLPTAVMRGELVELDALEVAGGIDKGSSRP